ncbi:hypothetical protein [Streptomyces sp. NPDC057910]|uniref:hypothetical protein n=1 Tax=Streptomyces sp. NPDC057910 TaxID=3346278 RepID=UPI0036E4D7C4
MSRSAGLTPVRAVGHQLQAGQVADRGQDVSGVRALPAPLADQADGPDLLQREIQQLVGPAFFGQTVAGVGENAVVEAGIVQLHGVKSARSAVPAFRPARFSGPLPA